MNENFLNEDNSLTSSSSESSSSSSESITKNVIFNPKASSSSPKIKPMDVFDFTPSPPTPAASSSMHLNNIEIIPLNPANAVGSGNPPNQQKHRSSPPSKNLQGHNLTTSSNPTSITITPINAAYFGTKDKEKEKKLEKKKKRKREDDLMGPPVRKKVSSPKKRASSKSPIQKPLLSPLSPGMSGFPLNSPQNPNMSGLQGSSSQAMQGFNLKNDDDAFFDMSILQGMSQEDKLMMLSLNQQGSQSTNVISPLPSPGSLNNLNNLSLNLKNRKGSLSAVIDKLKSAQTGDELDLIEDAKDKSSSEYQVKSTGRDGIKITINKTKISGSSNSSSSKSSKSASGLKPGVNSGPASKKSSSSSSLSPKNSGQKFLYQKSSSSGSLPLKSSGLSVSPKLTSKSQHSSPQSSKTSSSNKDLSKILLKDSQSQMEVLKMMGISPQNQAIDGFLKSFDSSKKFQIPKLSARPSQSLPTQTTQGPPQNSQMSQKKEEKEDFVQHNQQKYNSAPSTPIQSLTPSPTAEIGKSLGDPYVNKYMSSGSSKFGLFQEHNQMQNSLQNSTNSQKTKKLFKSISSEQLYDKDSKDMHGGITRQVTTPSPTFNPSFNHDSLLDLPIFNTNSNNSNISNNSNNSNNSNSNKPKENLENMRSQLQVHMIQKQNFHDPSNSMSGLGNLGSLGNLANLSNMVDREQNPNLASLGNLASPGLMQFSDDLMNEALNAGEI